MPKLDLESGLLQILKTFSPKERELLKFRYRRLLESVVHFEERKFTLKDIIEYASSQERGGRANADDLSMILKRLEENDLIVKDAKGFYEISPASAWALGETFGFIWTPRIGKTGFLNYIAGSQERVMFWYCLHRSGPLSPEEAHEFTGYAVAKCEWFMKKFEKQELLKRVETNRYRVDNEQKIFGMLYEGYLDFCGAGQTVRDMIIDVMQHHEKASGSEIYKDLKKMGQNRDISGIYGQLHELENDGIVRKTGETRRVRGTLEEYYELNYEDLHEYREKLNSMIQDMVKSEFKNSVRDEFFDEVAKQKLHVAKLFLDDLKYLVLWYERQIETVTLWENLIKNLSQDKIHSIITEFSSVKSDEEFKKRLERISRKLRMSPLVISIIYLFEMVTAKKE